MIRGLVWTFTLLLQVGEKQMNRSIAIGFRCAAILVTAVFAIAPILYAQGPQFSVSFEKERSAAPLDGRVLLLLSTDTSAEPRNQIAISYKTQIVFGMDVDGMKPGEMIAVS